MTRLPDHPQDFLDEIRKSFQALAEHTRPACGACRSPFGCCAGGNCEVAKDMAKDIFGVDLEPVEDRPRPDIPFLGHQGCVVPPYLRPACTAHVCEMHLADESDWQDRYWDLREAAEDLLYEADTRAQGRSA